MNIHRCKCGAKPTLWVDSTDPVYAGYSYTEWRVACPKCNLKTDWFNKDKLAVDEWNKLVKEE